MQHELTVKDMLEADVVFERKWDGPVLVVGESGENLFVVNTPSEVLVPLFRLPEEEPKRTEVVHDLSLTMLLAAKEVLPYKGETHVVTVREEGSSVTFTGMFLAPVDTEVEPKIMDIGG